MTTRQVAMVIDLNKCIGCQACTAACKSLWTDEPGQEYMLWNNVETKPGPGYPREWEEKGTRSGWKDGQLQYGGLHDIKEFGEPVPLNHEAVYFQGTEERLQRTAPLEYGPNWHEDSSAGTFPNNYHFYLPRLCNHCTKPACLEACPVRAIYKREQDGIVLVDQDKCQGFRLCNQACPYDKVYFNFVTRKTQKCIFCFPRLEAGVAPACARQCPGRLRFVGFLEDDGPIHKLVYEWKVALPLHPEYGTEPNVYYVPPILPPNFDAEGRFDESSPRVPMEYLRYLFGPEVDAALITLHEEIEKKKAGKPSELMDLLIARDWKSLFNIPDVKIASTADGTFPGVG
jgi:DMSO reductase family type II enzyme iron-sulfur subunit